MSAPPPFSIACRRPFLIVTFGKPQGMLSWSLTKPGFRFARRVAWLEVRDDDLPSDVDAGAWLSRRMADAGLADAVALITSRDVASVCHASASVDGITAVCVTTVGLSNAERIGHRMGPTEAAGTINTLVHVSRPLARAAFIEAIALIAQARSIAVVDSRIRRGGVAITGTGTDCVVMAAPRGLDGVRYAGLHTAIGEAIGICVYEATARGIKSWLIDNSSQIQNCRQDTKFPNE